MEKIWESACLDMMEMAEELLKLALPGKRFFLMVCDDDEEQGEALAISTINEKPLIFFLGKIVDQMRKEAGKKLTTAADSEGGDHD